MNRFLKPIRAAVILMAFAALTSCALGPAATPSEPTVDINAVKTAAAATAIVELTKIALQASPTLAPTQTPTTAPATPTAATAQTESATQDPALLASTATIAPAAGLPATETPVVAPMAGTPGTVPSLTPLATAAANTGPTCLNSKFVADVTVPDGTVYQPGEKFTKAWRIQNTGTCSWDEGFGFIRWSGPAMNSTDVYFSKNDQPVGPGGITDFYIEMRAPYEAGDYVAHWVMVSDAGKTFGGDFTVVIKVSK